jgi:hypothetical protein
MPAIWPTSWVPNPLGLAYRFRVEGDLQMQL